MRRADEGSMIVMSHVELNTYRCSLRPSGALSRTTKIGL